MMTASVLTTWVEVIDQLDETELMPGVANDYVLNALDGQGGVIIVPGLVTSVEIKADDSVIDDIDADPNHNLQWATEA